LSAATGTFGDDSTDQFISYDGTTLTLGSGVTIGKNINQTVTVGSGGDYATLNDALEDLSRIVPAYTPGGFTATIELLTGYVMSESMNIVGLDLSWIVITSSSTIAVDGSVFSGAVFRLERARGPKIDFSASSINGSPGDGWFELTDNSELVLGFGLTFDGTGPGTISGRISNVLDCRRSNFYAESATFLGTLTGLTINDGSRVVMPSLNLDTNQDLVSVTRATFISTLSTMTVQAATNNALINGIDGTIEMAFLDLDANSNVFQAVSLSGTAADLSSSTIYNYGDIGIRARGCDLNLFGSSVTRISGGSGTNGSNGDVVLSRGAIVRGETGTFGDNVTANTISVDGIVFK